MVTHFRPGGTPKVPSLLQHRNDVVDPYSSLFILLIKTSHQKVFKVQYMMHNLCHNYTRGRFFLKWIASVTLQPFVLHQALMPQMEAKDVFFHFLYGSLI